MKDLEVVWISQDFFTQFKNDPDDSIRDILGRPTTSIKPLFDDPSKMVSCVDYSYYNPFDEKSITLLSSFMPESSNYYVHLDGSEGGDGYGIAMSSIKGWVGDKVKKPIVKIDFMGSPTKKTYGKDFKSELFESLFQDLVERGFNIKILTFDRATIITNIRRIVEPYGTIVAPMSIDQCANYPILDYSKEEPPYFKSVSSKGQYDKPMVEFSNLVREVRLTVPYHERWLDIPYSFEHQPNKRRVIKVSGKQDDLGQAVGGSVFHVLNNEKYKGQETIKEWNIKQEPDKFEKQLEQFRIEANSETEELKKPNDKNFDRVPDEIGLDEDTFEDEIDSYYYI